MDNTTKPQNTQGDAHALDHNATLSALAFTTHLHEQSLPKDMPQEAPQEAQNAPTSEAQPKEGEMPQDQKNAEIEGKMTQGFDDLRQEFDTRFKGLDEKMQGIRDDIQSALNEQD